MYEGSIGLPPSEKKGELHSLSLCSREVNGMSGLPFQEFAFLESKGREYSPFRNSFPASLKGGQEGGKEGTRCRRLEMRICTHRGTVCRPVHIMYVSWC